MRPRRRLKSTETRERLLQRQRALLAAVTTDKRQNTWALELLSRRNAVARWRGQTGCSIREVMQALDSLPACSSATTLSH